MQFWNYNFTTYSYVYSSPAVVNGVVYVGSGGAGPNAGGNVYALNAADGAKLWSYTIGWTPNYSDSWVDSSPAVVGGVVYVGCDDGNVYALNAVNGDKLWNYTTTGGIAGMGGISSSFVVVDGVVYVYQDYTGVLYALNAHNGERLWNYTIYASYSGNMASPAVVNGIVYISSEDGQVYAFGSPMPSPSPTPSDTLPIVVGGDSCGRCCCCSGFLNVSKEMENYNEKSATIVVIKENFRQSQKPQLVLIICLRALKMGVFDGGVLQWHCSI